MAVETSKDRIRLNQIVGQRQEIMTVEGDVIVNDVKPDVLKIINTNGVICVQKRETLNGKVKLEGYIDTYIIYLADDEMGSIRTVNTKLDFSTTLDLDICRENYTLEESLCIKDFETKILNSRKIHIKSFIDVDLKLYLNEDIETIVEVPNNQDMQMLITSRNLMSLTGENTGKCMIKDTINVEDDLAEIMSVKFTLADIETKTSYNKVLIKGTANAEVMYLTEDNQISNVLGEIPVMGFVDMPNIADTSPECIAKAKLRNLKIEPNNMEEHSILVEAELDLFCRAYENKELNIIEDMYSLCDNVELKRKNVKATTVQSREKDSFKVKQAFTEPELLYGRILGVNLDPIIENTDIKDGRIKYTGKVNAEFFVSHEDNIVTHNYEIPFEFTLTSDQIKGDSQVETQINVLNHKTYNTDDGVVLEVEMEIIALLQNSEELDFVQDIDVTEDTNSNMYSMVIYFAKPGDTLWKIAKQFKSKVEDIARINQIEDENKIYVGQQLYIPKFSKSRISI